MNQSGSVLSVELPRTWLNGHRKKPAAFSAAPEGLVDAALESSPIGLVVLCSGKIVRLVTRAASDLLGLDRALCTRNLSFLGLLRSCRALDAAAVRHIGMALEDASTEAQELVLSVPGREGRRDVAIDIRRAGHLGWVLSVCDTTQTRQTQDWLLEHVSSDPVTGLWNRQHLLLMLQDTLSRLAEPGAPAPPSVLLIGLHHFRRVTESLSLGTGDVLLRMAGERLAALLGPDDMLAYFGEGEFAFVWSRTKSRASIESLCSQVLDSVCAPYCLDGHVVNLDVRIGIASAPDGGCAPDELLANATLALQAAAPRRAERLYFFEPGLTERARQRRALESDLTMALGRREFELHYQPQVDVHTSRVTGFEALIRWRSPSRGLVPPIDFIPLSEQMGLIVEIGDWVLHEACRHAVHWPEDVTVAINASPLQFESGTFARSVADALLASRLPAHRLEVEVTESLLLRETGAVLETLERLRELGVRLVLDDFGTGYASLSQLSRFHFDKIKIDQSFIRLNAGSPQNSAIVRAIAALGHSLGIPTTAEGVETELQLQQITEDGCTSVQGYLFGRPVPVCEVLPMLGRLQKQAA